MSLTTFDGQFCFRQSELATKGHDHSKKEMTDAQYKQLQESPFMKRARAQEEHTWTMTCDRDRKRKERDPQFEPKDSDFSAAKAFDYEKVVNYYKVLGVEEYASLEDIKKAYKKLSLIYHPDKTTGMPREQQEEHSAIFMELKNAYLTLGDQATRRQYDRDRDHMDAGAEVNGFKKKPDRPSFDATAVLKKMQEMQKPPGGEVKVEVYVKLEKFFYGGPKAFKRSRRVIKDSYESYEDKQFRIDVPKGAQENWACKMKGGDMNWETQPDRLRFVFRSKPHKDFERSGDNLVALKPVLLRPDTHLQPFLSTEVDSIGGRTVLLWGRNPIYSKLDATSALLHFKIQGEGIGSTGMLCFSAQMGAGKSAVKPADAAVVSVRTTYTKIQFFCMVHAEGTVEDLKRAIIEVLEWPEDQPVKIVKDLGDKKTAAFYSDKVVLNKVREVILDPPRRIYEVPMSMLRARELLQLVLAACNESQFIRGMQRCKKYRGTVRHESLLKEQWAAVSKMAPLFGYPASLEGLWTAIQRALWIIRDEPDAAIILPRFRELGFEPRDAPKPKVSRRRKLPRPEVEHFLQRNFLGPRRWVDSAENMPYPGSETDSDQGAAEETAGQADDDWENFMSGNSSGSGASPASSAQQQVCRHTHGNFASAVHPAMVRRTKRQATAAPVCEFELAPMFDPGHCVRLFTKPACFLQFYSNLKQPARGAARPGQLPPPPMFAVSLCCPSGAKRIGREAWRKLRGHLAPLVMRTAFHMVAEARRLLPRPLAAEPAFPEDDYELEDGVRVMLPGEDEGGLEDEGEDSNDEREIMALAKRRAVANAKAKKRVESRGSKAGSSVQVKQERKHLGARKPRVLCLHGVASGREVFEVQAMRLFAACKGKVELIVLDGPEECSSTQVVQSMREWFDDKPMRQYAEAEFDHRNWRAYRDVRGALGWIQGKLREHAPVDGVLGFSHGANFAAMLAAQSFAGTGMPLSFVVLMCPTAPGYAEQLPELFGDSAVQVPALITRGELEEYNDDMKQRYEDKKINTMGEKMPSDHVVKLFRDARVQTHSEGHRPFPNDRKDSDKLCRVVLEFIHENASRPPCVRVDVPHGEADGDGMFDFDTLEDLDEVDAIAEEIRAERLDKRRTRLAVKEVWLRDARMAAKREFFFRAAERRALAEQGEHQAEPASLASSSCPHAAGLGSPEQAAEIWKRLATRAFRYGDFFLALAYYSRELSCLREDDTVRLGTAHSNMSACLARVGHTGEALEEARKASELRPTWGRAWARLGVASAGRGEAHAAETRDAWFRAVEVEPAAAHVEGLSAALRGAPQTRNPDQAHQNKEKGCEAMRVQEWGRAVAHFTVAIAMLPAPPSSSAYEDPHAFLRSVLHTNRCAAFSRARLWSLAVDDGLKAVEHKDDYAKAYCQLGVAQLGSRLNEQAYTSFAKALFHEENCRTAARGREVCLGLIPHWDSLRSHRRNARFARDARRPRGTTKIYALSDIHYDHAGHEEWAHGIHGSKFLDDVLIIAGNVADSFRAVQRGLTTLRAKFRRVFYLPGNHEMWINKLEERRFPDSLSKLWAIMELCDELDIDVFPAAVCQDMYVVPLHSWYNAHFDIKDPFPDPKSEADKYARWPIDAQQQVWRYMLALNRSHLDRPCRGTVLTFSHFAPRPGLPTWRETGVNKTTGCAELDDQVRDVRSSCHIYGHTHYKHYQAHDGVTYIHRPLEVVGEGHREPITCVFNGHHLCCDSTST